MLLIIDNIEENSSIGSEAWHRPRETEGSHEYQEPICSFRIRIISLQGILFKHSCWTCLSITGTATSTCYPSGLVLSHLRHMFYSNYVAPFQKSPRVFKRLCPSIFADVSLSSGDAGGTLLLSWSMSSILKERPIEPWKGGYFNTQRRLGSILWIGVFMIVQWLSWLTCRQDPFPDDDIVWGTFSISHPWFIVWS